MSIYLNNSSMLKAYIGSKEVESTYIGSKKQYSSVPVFDPLNDEYYLSGYFNPTSPENYSQTGGAVSSLKNLQTSFPSLVQNVEAYKPVVSDINGIGALQFDGSVSNLEIVNNAQGIFNGSATWMFVVESNYNNDNIALYFSDQTVSNANFNYNGETATDEKVEYHLGIEGGTQFAEIYLQNGDKMSQGTSNIQRPKVIFATIDFEMGQGSVGSSDGDKTDFTLTGNYQQISTMKLGHVGNIDSGRAFEGRIGAGLIYREVLSSIEINKRIAFLSDMYGLSYTEVS